MANLGQLLAQTKSHSDDFTMPEFPDASDEVAGHADSAGQRIAPDEGDTEMVDLGAAERPLLTAGKDPTRRRSHRCRWLPRWLIDLIIPPGKLSTFRAVYVPACIGIVGPTIFLRLSYVVAEVGLYYTLIMISLIFCIACMTVTGVSAIVTNGKMRPGGPYFLISRTLGAELGGAIGVVLLAEHVIASVYFLSTFGEIVSLSSNTVTGPIDYSYKYSFGIIFSSVCLLICLGMALYGNRGFSTVSIILYTIKLTPLVVAMGSFFFQDPSASGHLDPAGKDANASAVWEHFTGPRLSSLKSNLYEHEKEGEVLTGGAFANFLAIFGIVFAPFSGLACGTNMTGHVKSSFSIPRGMFSAAVTGIVFFAAMSFTLSLCMENLYQIPQGARDVVLRICVREWIVLLGMSCTCLGSAVVHLQAAGNTLRSMTMDGLVPFINPGRFPLLRDGRSFWWRNWHNFTGWLLMQGFVFLGSPAAVAPLLSLVFLFFTSMMNASVLLLLYIGAPNFRPRFRLFNRVTLALGTAVPLVAMVGINQNFTYILSGIFLGLVILFTFLAPANDFGDVSNALSFSQVRKYLLALGKNSSAGESLKFWRPAPLLLETHAEFLQDRNFHLAQVANSMKKGGLFVIASVLRDVYGPESIRARQEELQSWGRLISQRRLKALPVCTVAPSLREGVRQCMQLAGLGPVRPNLILLNWFGSQAECGLQEFVGIMRDASMSEIHLAVCRNFDFLDTSEITFYADWMRLNPPPKVVHGVASKMTLDVWALPLLLPDVVVEQAERNRACSTSAEGDSGSATEDDAAAEGRRDDIDGWPEYTFSLELCLLLGSTLRMNTFWAKHTTLRLIAISDTLESAPNLEAAWVSYLSQARIRATVRVVSAEHMLRSAGFDPQPTPIVLGQDQRPLSTPSAPMFFEQVPAHQRLEEVRRMLQRESLSACISMLPLSPLPVGRDGEDPANLTYAEHLHSLTERIPACMLLHAKATVMYTEL